MNQMEEMPLQIITVGNVSFLCFGDIPEKRRIVVEGIPFISMQKLAKTFPELTHRLSALARCVNFLSTGTTFRVISDPIQFKKTYFPLNQNEVETSLGKVDFFKMRSPHFEGNMFIFYAWNEVSDLPYKVSFVYPFTDSPNDAKYEILQNKYLSV